LVTKKWLVAIVDDELDIVNLFRDCLRGINDILIFTFTDPFIALEHFITNKDTYFLIISDLRMPAMNGMKLLNVIKNVNCSISTTLLTIFNLDENKQKKSPLITNNGKN